MSMEFATGPSGKAAWEKARAPNQAKVTSLLMPVYYIQPLREVSQQGY